MTPVVETVPFLMPCQERRSRGGKQAIKLFETGEPLCGEPTVPKHQGSKTGILGLSSADRLRVSV